MVSAAFSASPGRAAQRLWRAHSQKAPAAPFVAASNRQNTNTKKNRVLRPGIFIFAKTAQPSNLLAFRKIKQTLFHLISIASVTLAILMATKGLQSPKVAKWLVQARAVGFCIRGVPAVNFVIEACSLNGNGALFICGCFFFFANCIFVQTGMHQHLHARSPELLSQ